MTTYPPTRRPGQNSGMKAKTAREVEAAPCEHTGTGPHVLTNVSGVTRCLGCLADWATLDAELNQRGESWLG